MSRRRLKGRPVNGILLLDKPLGISSNHALQRVKRAFNARKAGHTGALDPLATGMLPVCLGEATKFSQFLLDADKTYQVIAQLGVRTTTSDADGEVVSTRPVNVTRAQLDEQLATFEGQTQQVPSMYSALKHEGQPLYKYARQGITVEREARPINVYELHCDDFDGEFVTLTLRCSKGTYVRTIIDDLGEKLGCGAHVTMLRRLQVAGYPVERMVTLEQLEDAITQAKQEEVALNTYLDPLLLPMDTAVMRLPEVNMPPITASYLQLGQAVQVSGAPAEGTVRLTVGAQAEFIGVGVIDDDGKVAPKRLVVTAEDA